MFGGPKNWADRRVKPKPCRNCGIEFQPSCGGALYCTPCKPEMASRKRDANAARMRAYRKENPERAARMKAEHDLKRFGMTFMDYEKMLKEQGGRCAICATDDPKGRGKFRKFAVDHCHAKGHVRALLCHRCNGALGMVGDSPAVLKKMIQYLTEHAQ